MSILGKGVLRAGSKGANLARMGTLRTHLPQGHKFADSGPGFTFHSTWALEGEWDLIRLVWQNFRVTTWAVDGASIAPSARLGNGYDPTDAAGNAVAFTPLTFNAEGAFSDFPPASGATTSFTVPASADGYYPATVASDWLAKSSLPRLDIADGKQLVMGRVYSSGQMNLGQTRSPDITDGTWDAESGGRIIKSFHKAGNLLTSGFTAPTGPSHWLAYTGVQTYTRARGATVMGVGDSMQQGHSVDGSQHYAPGHYATALLTTPSRPVSFINAARSGGTSAQFHQHARTYFDLFKPEVVVISVWTPNDTRDQASADLCYARAMALANIATRAGAVPVLSTALPFDLNAGDDALRKSNNARARASGLLVADYTAVAGDGATPERVLPAYRAASGSHLNPAGYGEVGRRALAPVIDQALA